MDITIGKNASYLKIKEFTEDFKPLTTKHIGNDVYADYNKDGELIGIEILGVVIAKYYEDYEEK